MGKEGGRVSKGGEKKRRARSHDKILPTWGMVGQALNVLISSRTNESVWLCVYM